MILKNLAVNMVRPGYFPVMVEKVWRRIAERGRRGDARVAAEWCAAKVEPFESLALKLDAELWAETQAFGNRLQDRARARLADIDLDLGGGVDYRLLYFMTRYLKPRTVVETGVGAGFSTQAILTALAANRSGRLLSSDFPYFRFENPAQYAGILVEEELKKPWTLYLQGDRKNLPRICRSVDAIDLFHYDSDKSYGGRALAMDLVRHRLADNAVVIMDDIENNLFFRDHVESRGLPCNVFEFQGKYLGLIGLGK